MKKRDVRDYTGHVRLALFGTGARTEVDARPYPRDAAQQERFNRWWAAVKLPALLALLDGSMVAWFSIDDLA